MESAAAVSLRPAVAPLAGSVDRNIPEGDVYRLAAVAPLAGSVDRNGFVVSNVEGISASLPSRGAWIEMQMRSGSIAKPSSRSPRGERG